MSTALDAVLFAHERDLIGNLRRFPLAARFRLDHIGVALTLEDWQALTLDQRTVLSTHPVASEEERCALKGALAAMLRAHQRHLPGAPAERLPAYDATDRVPPAVADALCARGLRLDRAGWAELPPLARFALVKLTRQGHHNRRLPALLQDLFGPAPSDTAPGNPTSARQSSADR